MKKLRLPGSWKVRLQSVAGAAAAAYAASVWALVQSHHRVGASGGFHLLWAAIVLLGGLGLLVAVFAVLLERRDGFEFIPEAEEEALRARRPLIVSPPEAGEPLRGDCRGISDATPRHVKVLAVLALTAWAVTLPFSNRSVWEAGVRMAILGVAVVPSVAAVFFYIVFKARTALRLVQEASED